MTPRLTAAITLVAVAALSAGVLVAYATTTTTASANYGYDHLAALARGGDRNPLRPFALPALLTPGVEDAFAPVGFASRVGVAAKAASGAESSVQGALLREHLRLTEKYGSAGVRNLENGRIRYYGDIRPARSPGEMAGQRTVREWNPATGAQRTWLETVDQQGRVRIVRPETGGPKRHYYFDEKGGYSGSG